MLLRFAPVHDWVASVCLEAEWVVMMEGHGSAQVRMDVACYYAAGRHAVAQL